jgi:dihydropteroate synthase
MQHSPSYGDVVEEVRTYLRSRVQFAVESGVETERIVIDPGIGFGKNLEHILALLRGLFALTALGRPVLVGTSRKTFLGKLLDAAPEERLEGSLAAAVAAVLAGANMIRMHDVKEAARAVRVADALRFPSPLTGKG